MNTATAPRVQRSSVGKNPTKKSTTASAAAPERPRDGLATTKDAMSFLRLSQSAVRALIAQDVFEVRRIGRTVRLTWASLHRYVNGEQPA